MSAHSFEQTSRPGRLTPAVPYWKVRSAGLGNLAEAVTIGCCEAISLCCYVVLCLKEKRDGILGVEEALHFSLDMTTWRGEDLRL